MVIFVGEALDFRGNFIKQKMFPQLGPPDRVRESLFGIAIAAQTPEQTPVATALCSGGPTTVLRVRVF